MTVDRVLRTLFLDEIRAVQRLLFRVCAVIRTALKETVAHAAHDVCSYMLFFL